MTRHIERLNLFFILFFGVLALVLANWTVLRSPTLLARDDNPRLVEAELRVRRGRILDRDGKVLAETVGELTVERFYHSPYSPAIGYYSLRYGVAGVEATYDEILRGQSKGLWANALDTLLHRSPIGLDVKTTLDSRIQSAAEQAMGEQVGAVIVLDAGSGDILALVSRPGFDPNLLDDQFDQLSVDERAPLLNRATQGLYQPGSALQLFIVSLSLEANLITLQTDVPQATDTIQVEAISLSCITTPPPDSTLADALSHGCPAPIPDLAVQLGEAGLSEGLAVFGFYELPELPLELSFRSSPTEFASEEALIMEALGQGGMTPSPLQVAWALAALANEGIRPPIRLVSHIEAENGGWDIVVPSGSEIDTGLSASTIERVTRAMVESVQSGATQEAASSTVQVAGHVGIGVSGEEQIPHSWFLGFAPANAPVPLARYLVVVLLENTDDTSSAARIGGLILGETVGQ